MKPPHPYSLPAPAEAATARLHPLSSSGPTARQYLLATVLFLITLFTTTTLGAGWYLSTRTDVVTTLVPWLAPETVLAIWTSPVLLTVGFSFSGPVLLILLAHELGHFVTCRRYGLPATPPYFLPLPLALGTLGAFIRIRAPIRSKRQLLDVGASGPLAGFAVLAPFLLYGVARSRPALVLEPPSPELAEAWLLVPGKSLAMELATRLFHGPLPQGAVLDLHPFALAAWVGLLATALNLLPLGQLDGGHVLYAATGRLQGRLAKLFWLALVAAGLLWQGWWVWAVVVLAMGLRHPPVVDEEAPLDFRRTLVAALCGLLFLLCFMPVPVSLLAVGG